MKYIQKFTDLMRRATMKSRPVRLPQIPQAEKDRREEYRRKEQEIEDARYEAYLAKLNRANGIGVERK